jgi:TonB family protein
MAERFHNDRWGRCAAMALAAALLAGLGLRAQDDPDKSDPVVLDNKAVSKLLISNAPPDYPAIAKVNFIQGEVRVRVFVSRDGRVTKVHAIKGHPFLVVSAMDAIRDWTYKPYRVGKRTREFTTLVSIHFNLHPKVLSDLPPSAERDLEARVEPPKVADQPADPPSDSRVRLRILVDSKGKALDAQRISGNESDAREAEEEVTQWRFLPAHWGSLPVPWYLDVDVPVRHAPA